MLKKTRKLDNTWFYLHQVSRIGNSYWLQGLGARKEEWEMTTSEYKAFWGVDENVLDLI